MNLEQFAAARPSLWYVTFRGGAESIRETGFLSAAELLSRSGRGAEASKFRPEVETVLQNGQPRATLRNQTRVVNSINA